MKSGGNVVWGLNMEPGSISCHYNRTGQIYTHQSFIWSFAIHNKNIIWMTADDYLVRDVSGHFWTKKSISDVISLVLTSQMILTEISEFDLNMQSEMLQ